MFDFLEKKRSESITKEELATMLSTSPEALAAFEQAYASKVLQADEASTNFFDINSRQAAAMKNSLPTQKNDTIDDIKKRIVLELLSKTSSWVYDGKSVTIHNGDENDITSYVSLEEIHALPEHLRPQLTGRYMQVDMQDPSYITLLDYYKHFLEEKDPRRKKQFYDLFRQGLDILDLDDITRKIIAMNKNSMGYWLPKVINAAISTGVIKVPKTSIVKVPTSMLQLTRLPYQSLTRTTLDIVNEFCKQAFSLDTSKEYFIKTGTYSSKFDFRNAKVCDPKEVSEIGEYLLYIHYQALQMASFLARPTIYGVSTTDEWVVREFIQDIENNPCIYKGLPLHTEYRVFVDFDTRKIIGINPYWDPKVMKQRFGHAEDANTIHNTHDYIIYSMHEPVLMNRYEQNKKRVIKYIQDLLANVDNMNGQWSIDIMQNGDDFWLIDMAVAESSALYECVPKSLRKTLPESWIPPLS